MSEQHLTHLTMPTYPLHQLTTLLLEEEAKEVLLKHGCTIEEHDYPEECLIFFPEGTTKTEILLRLMLPRYRIKLPDGYELRETYDRYRQISLLSYLLEQQANGWNESGHVWRVELRFKREALHELKIVNGLQGIEDAGLPQIRFHDLRHSAATIMLCMGVHPKVVQELLGHGSISMTLDTYSHRLPSMQQEAMDKLNGLFDRDGLDDEDIGGGQSN